MVAVGYTSTAPVGGGGGGGDATAANQVTQIARLTSIEADLPAPGQAAMAASMPVAIASNQSAVAVTVASSGLPTGAATSAAQATGNASLSSVDGKLGALGQAAMAASAPVVIASNQSTVPVSAATLPLPADAATQTTLAALNTKVTTVNTGAVVVSTSALPSGAATAAKQPALGTAGAAATDVITVQGIASGTAQPVSGTVTANIGTSGSLALDASVTGLQVTQGSATSGQKGGLAAGAVTTAAPTYTTAQTSPLSLTTGGALRTATEATTTSVALTGSDQAVVAAATVYRGFTIRETAGAAAVVVIYDHASAASGTIIEQISLAAGESAREFYPGGITCAAGIYADIVSGTVAGSVRKAA